MGDTHAYIYDKLSNDISDNVTLVNKRSNPFGWSSADIEYMGEIIGFHESGELHMKEPFHVVYVS